jgi:glucokinase
MPGSLEGAIGNCSVAARTEGRFTDTRALVEAHLAGDAEATRVWRRSVRALAVAAASIANAVDPELVVIGGGIARAGAALFEPLAEHLDAVEWRPLGHRVRVVPAALGDLAGAIGAARAALEGGDR